MMEVHERARRLARAARVAVQGQRGSDQAFALAVTLVHGFGLSQDDALAVLLHEWNPRCLPPWSEAELRHKVGDAARRGQPPGGKRWGWLLDEDAARQERRGEAPGAGASSSSRPKRSRFCVEALRRFRREECERREWWRERSPVRDPGSLTPGEVLGRLFRPGERVLVFDNPESQGQWLYVVGKGWFELGKRPGELAKPCRAPQGGYLGLWYHAQPVDGLWRCRTCDYWHDPRTGSLLANRVCPACAEGWSVDQARGADRLLSRRSEANVTAFRYLVLEHDPPPGADEGEYAALWAGFVAALPLPVRAFTSSGGKSLHALVYLPAPDKASWDRLREVCIRWLEPFGADKQAIRAVQLTRLPNVFREHKQQMQDLIWFDPANEDEVSILARAGTTKARAAGGGKR